MRTFSLPARLVVVVLLFTGSLQASAASPVHVLFREVSIARFSAERPRDLFPAAFRALALEPDALQSALRDVPSEADFLTGTSAPTWVLPNPEGTASRFAVVEAPILDEALARKFPEIRTFRGQGLSDPAETLILDVSPAGLHAMVLSPRGTILVDPVANGDDVHHIVYFKKDAAKIDGPFSCHDQELPDVADVSAFSESRPGGELPRLRVGGNLRTYRTAIGVTGEYSAAVCAPAAAAVPCALSAVVTVLNRVDGILERDASVRMVLVANENLVIYTDPATDSYTNASLNTMLVENQSKLDTVIGTSNYDFGHVFGTAGGGTAYIGVACNPTYKAQGATSLVHPLGDPFSVDYVAHEMGHQWGARHSFNGTTDGCVFRDASYAYEPGSGSTLLSYAGLCGAEMLQLHHDDYYHATSLDQIFLFVSAGGSMCGTATPNGNVPPVVTAPVSYIIPIKTPFALTGSATDANGDVMSYAWEETDLGSPGPPNDDVAAERPILRSFPPATVPTRTFPKLSDLLGNVATLGESLPTRTRNMFFRLTVRDNRIGGGEVTFGNTKVTVQASFGPFAVTSPNTAVIWPALSSQTITWNVTGTNVAPVNCSNVAVTLSTNGGNTFPLTLLASTPNDGSQAVTLPNLATTKARIKVECVGNIFFDVSNANFSITGGPVAGTNFYTLVPCRLFDTRDLASPTAGAPLTPNTLTTFKVGGKCGLPLLATAMSANVSVTLPTAGGAFKLFAGDLVAVPTATTLSYSTGQTRGNNAIVSLSLDGAGNIKIKNESAGSAHIIVDVNGYFQ
ncbi:MAG: zinc-dependent metalloprotease family protein [Acidobacteriota bacterium]